MSSEDLLVWRNPIGSYEVRGAVTGVVIVSGDNAAEVVQAGIDALAGTGFGTLTLSRGNYPLSQPLRLSTGVSLIGCGDGSRLVVTDNNADGIGIIARDCNRPVIENLTVVAQAMGTGDAGVEVRSCGEPCLTRVTSVGFARHGFRIFDQNLMPTLDACSAYSNGSAGFLIQHHQRGLRGNYPPIMLHGCRAIAGGTGFFIEDSTVVNLNGCTAYQCADHGFHVRSNSNSVLIAGCRTFQLGKHAVLMEGSYELNVTGNVFCWHGFDGVVIRGGAWGLVSGNEVIDSGSHNPGGPDEGFKLADVDPAIELRSGVVLEASRGFNVTANTIFNWPQSRLMDKGIDERDGCHDNRIEDNLVNYTQAPGIQVANPASQPRIGNLIREHPAFYGQPDCDWLQSYRPELLQQHIHKAFLGPGDSA